MSAEDSFLDKWWAAEPWHRLLLVFEPADCRHTRALIECIGYELRRTALTGSDPVVISAKLGWWREEWQHALRGAPRHPLTAALHSRHPAAGFGDTGLDWIDSAALLAQDVVDTDLAARTRRWQAHTAAQSRTQADLLGIAPGDGYAHALVLQSERLPAAREELARGRLPAPLSLLAEHGLTRDEFVPDRPAALAAAADHAGRLAAALGAAQAGEIDLYRRRQLALAGLRAMRLVSNPAAAWSGSVPLPALRALWSVWRVRQP